MIWVLSERDYQRLQRLLRAFEAGKLNKPPVLRRRSFPAGGGGAPRRAFVNQAVPAISSVTCFLDADSPDSVEITVDCDIDNDGTSLADATPLLAVGTPMYVIKDATALNGWRSQTLFAATQGCT